MNRSKQNPRVNKLSLKKQYSSQRSTSYKSEDNSLFTLWNLKAKAKIKGLSELEVNCTNDNFIPAAKKAKVEEICNVNELEIKIKNSEENESSFSLFCPKCQIPFSALIGQTQRWHMDECMDANYQDLKECPDGPSCNSHIPSHYMKYSHFCLAAVRSGLNITKEKEKESLHIIPLIPESEAINFTTLNPPLKHKAFIEIESNLSFNSLKQKEGNIDNSLELSVVKSKINVTENEVNGQVYESSTEQCVIFNCSKSDSTINVVDQEIVNSLNKNALQHLKSKIFITAGMENSNEKNRHESECSKQVEMNQNEKSEKASDIKDYTENKSKENLVSSSSQRGIAASQHNFQTQIDPLNLFSLKKKQVTITSFFKTPTVNINDNKKKFSFVKSAVSSVLHQNKSLSNKLMSRMPIVPECGNDWNSNIDKSMSQKDSGRQRKVCPFYKKIPDTTFCVDAFNYGAIPGIKHYFLSHFHSDHYHGLTRHFNYPIYCSPVTANLVTLKIHLPRKYLHSLKLNDPIVIDGVEVILLDANHCPGSVMFLFCLADGRHFLHTGDFRATPRMELYDSLKNCNIQRLYLDTTYCNPRYDFPSQDVILKLITSLVVQRIKQNPKILIACGSYTIGKEKVFMAIAETINCKIWANKAKSQILECLEDEKIKSHLVTDAKLAQVHILPMNQLTIASLHQYRLKFAGIFNEVIGLKPTGWEHRSRLSANLHSLKPTCSGPVSVYGIPYSEHSSFNELQRFVQFIQPQLIIPTVNVGSAKSRKEMDNIFQKWL